MNIKDKNDYGDILERIEKDSTRYIYTPINENEYLVDIYYDSNHNINFVKKVDIEAGIYNKYRYIYPDFSSKDINFPYVVCIADYMTDHYKSDNSDLYSI